MELEHQSNLTCAQKPKRKEKCQAFNRWNSSNEASPCHVVKCLSSGHLTVPDLYKFYTPQSTILNSLCLDFGTLTLIAQ